MHALLFVFFQAEDGIRGLYVTGVQTCALPISVGARDGDRPRPAGLRRGDRRPERRVLRVEGRERRRRGARMRSEERRVGKECRSWWSRYDENNYMLSGGCGSG